MNSWVYDIVIIGAGPAGLATAIEARRAGLRYLVVDKGSVVHNIARFQREMSFFSTPELLEIGDLPFIVSGVRPTSADCVNYYRRAAEYFSLNCRFFYRVVGIGREEGVFRLQGGEGEDLRCRAVVLATGYYDTPKKLGVPGESLPHVSSYYHDPSPYYRQKVLIVGGRNSAVEAALDLTRHGAYVTVVHRGSELSTGVKYWILPDFENRVRDRSIELRLDTVVEEFRPSSATLKNTAGEVSEIPSDFVFTLIGYRADTEFLQSCGIGIDPATQGPVYDEVTMETTIPGLYVAGGLVGGDFNNKVFIENGRRHGAVIVRAITSRG